MHVGIEALLDASFLDQLGRPRLVRHGILQRSGDIDKLARDLRIVALCTAVEPVFPAPHSREVRFSVGAARRRGGEVRLAVCRARHSGSRIVHPLGEERRRREGQN